MKRLPILWNVALYFVTTAIAGVWFLALNAVTVCVMCHDHMHYGFPVPYIDIGWAVPNKDAVLWPGMIADAALVLLAGFIAAKGISAILRLMTIRFDSSVF